MMKKILRCLAVMAAVTAVFSSNSVAFARKYNFYPDGGICTINVEGTTLTISGNQASPENYKLKNSDISFAAGDTGLTLTFVTAGGNTKTVRLGKTVKSFTVSGTLDSLTVGDTLNYLYTLNLDVNMDTLSIDGAAKHILSENTVIDNLLLNNKDATVISQEGAVLQSSDRVADSETYLDLTVKEQSRYASASYNKDTGVLTLTAKSEGCTVSQAMQDVKLFVRRSSDHKAIGGSWDWPYLDESALESGRYIFRFMPSDNAYRSIEVFIDFVALNPA